MLFGPNTQLVYGFFERVLGLSLAELVRVAGAFAAQDGQVVRAAHVSALATAYRQGRVEAWQQSDLGLPSALLQRLSTVGLEWACQDRELLAGNREVASYVADRKPLIEDLCMQLYEAAGHAVHALVLADVLDEEVRATLYAAFGVCVPVGGLSLPG